MNKKELFGTDSSSEGGSGEDWEDVEAGEEDKKQNGDDGEQENEEEDDDEENDDDVFEDGIKDFTDLFIGLGKNAGVAVSSLTGGFKCAFLYNLNRMSCCNGQRGFRSSKSSSSKAGDFRCEGVRCHVGASHLSEMRCLRHLHPTVRQECYNTNMRITIIHIFADLLVQRDDAVKKGWAHAQLVIRSGTHPDGL